MAGLPRRQGGREMGCSAMRGKDKFGPCSGLNSGSRQKHRSRWLSADAFSSDSIVPARLYLRRLCRPRETPGEVHDWRPHIRLGCGAAGPAAHRCLIPVFCFHLIIFAPSMSSVLWDNRIQGWGARMPCYSRGLDYGALP